MFVALCRNPHVDVGDVVNSEGDSRHEGQGFQRNLRAGIGRDYYLGHRDLLSQLSSVPFAGAERNYGGNSAYPVGGASSALWRNVPGKMRAQARAIIRPHSPGFPPLHALHAFHESTHAMKATYIEQQGAPEVLTYGDLPDPSPSASEVVIRVRATALKPSGHFRKSREERRSS